MPNENGIITAHFIFHWGVPTSIRPRNVTGLEIAILEFAPKGPRETWRYATVGMSRATQAHPDDSIRIRTELYTCTKQNAKWVDDLLAAVAAYPQDYATYLAEGDTINVAQPIDRNVSVYTGILLASPSPNDPPTLGLVGGLADNILVHRVVGILPIEVEYAERNGGNVLLERLMQDRELPLDVERPAVI